MDAARKAEFEELLRDTPYALVSELGRGAVADVLVVRQKFLRKKFALKILRPHMFEEDGHLLRLKREARCLGRIESPHVVEIVDMAEASNGMPYVVLDLMKGHSLARELELRRQLPPQEAIGWAQQALHGLRAAHEQGLIHRDITPANLFLQERAGEARTLKVMDFGLARVLPDFGSTTIRGDGGTTTSTGMIVGSPVYASPEALRGERLGVSADIFGIGLVLFEMLTGRGPLELDGMEVPPPSQYVSSIAPGLDTIVECATHSVSTERYGSAGDFLAALERMGEKCEL